jgi:sulfur-carrier protein
MPSQVPVKVKIRYFAILRDQRGASNEEYVTSAQSPQELYLELKSKYKFTLPVDRLRVAINADFVDWSVPLQEDDAIAFIPPVAGG